MKPGGSLRVVGVVLTTCLTFSCNKTEKNTQPAASASAQAAKLPPNVDAKLLQDLNTLTKVCQVDIKSGQLSCPQGEQRQLVSEFVAQQRDRAKSVATFATALADPKPELRTVAVNILYSAFRSPWGPNLKPGSVPAADADALLAATLKLPRAQALQAIPASVHAEMLANRGDALKAVLDKSGEAQLRSTAIRYLMTHGRLQAFPRVQEIAKVGDLPLTLAALESPSNMYSWSPSEQAAICPWAAGFLSDGRDQVAAKAGSLLSNCTGEYVDRLLEVGEAALKAGDMTGARLGAYRDLCAPHRRTAATAASSEQCDRSRKLLEAVVAKKELTEQTRTTALAALAYQWPDEDTLKLAKKLEGDSNKSLAQNASRTVARLEQRLRKDGAPSSVAALPPQKGSKAPARPTGAGVRPAPAPAPAPAAPATDNPF